MKNSIGSALMILGLVFGFVGTASAQLYTKQVVVANGGLFEFQAPFTDDITIGTFDPYVNTYHPFDTVRGESVQQVLIDSGMAYIAMGDSILKYDLNTLLPVDTLLFSGVRSLAVSGNHLLVGKWFGTGDFLAVYDKNTLALEFSVPLTNTVSGMVVIGDTLYAPFNVPGTIDQCPPFGCFDDSIGRIAVVDFPSQSHIYDIDLDTIGAAAAKSAWFWHTGIGRMSVWWGIECLRQQQRQPHTNSHWRTRFHRP